MLVFLGLMLLKGSARSALCLLSELALSNCLCLLLNLVGFVYVLHFIIYYIFLKLPSIQSLVIYHHIYKERSITISGPIFPPPIVLNITVSFFVLLLCGYVDSVYKSIVRWWSDISLVTDYVQDRRKIPTYGNVDGAEVQCCLRWRWEV